jgi:hypothetical protein
MNERGAHMDFGGCQRKEKARFEKSKQALLFQETEKRSLLDFDVVTRENVNVGIGDKDGRGIAADVDDDAFA